MLTTSTPALAIPNTPTPSSAPTAPTAAAKVFHTPIQPAQKKEKASLENAAIDPVQYVSHSLLSQYYHLFSRLSGQFSPLTNPAFQHYAERILDQTEQFLETERPSLRLLFTVLSNFHGKLDKLNLDKDDRLNGILATSKSASSSQEQQDHLHILYWQYLFLLKIADCPYLRPQDAQEAEASINVIIGFMNTRMGTSETDGAELDYWALAFANMLLVRFVERLDSSSPLFDAQLNTVVNGLRIVFEKARYHVYSHSEAPLCMLCCFMSLRHLVQTCVPRLVTNNKSSDPAKAKPTTTTAIIKPLLSVFFRSQSILLNLTRPTTSSPSLLAQKGEITTDEASVLTRIPHSVTLRWFAISSLDSIVLKDKEFGVCIWDHGPSMQQQFLCRQLCTIVIEFCENQVSALKACDNNEDKGDKNTIDVHDPMFAHEEFVVERALKLLTTRGIYEILLKDTTHVKPLVQAVLAYIVAATPDNIRQKGRRDQQPDTPIRKRNTRLSRIVQEETGQSAEQDQHGYGDVVISLALRWSCLALLSRLIYSTHLHTTPSGTQILDASIAGMLQTSGEILAKSPFEMVVASILEGGCLASKQVKALQGLVEKVLGKL